MCEMVVTNTMSEMVVTNILCEMVVTNILCEMVVTNMLCEMVVTNMLCEMVNYAQEQRSCGGEAACVYEEAIRNRREGTENKNKGFT